jgi:hypothetical protein
VFSPVIISSAIAVVALTILIIATIRG